MSSSRALSTAARTFFEKIGKPRFISAPMVEHSSLPWRLLVRNSGTDLAYTQMIHTPGFRRCKELRRQFIDWGDYEHRSGSEQLMNWAAELDKNTIVQFAGDDAETLVAAGMHIHHDVAAIDLNLGCPQRIAKKGHYGAYLLPEKELVVHLLSTMVKKLDCPITAKVRVLENPADTIELCKAIEDCGVSMLTVHGRTVAANKQLVGAADWDIIARVKRSLSIPVIANGGISCYDDALRCLQHTGADGVMAAEALLENPKLFSEEGDRRFRTDYVRAQLETAREFIELVEGYPQPHKCATVVRGHLFKMLTRFLTAPRNRDLQQQLLSAELGTVCAVVTSLQERLVAVGYEAEGAEEAGLLAGTGYYFRHRRSIAPSPVDLQPAARRLGQRSAFSPAPGDSAQTIAIEKFI